MYDLETIQAMNKQSDADVEQAYAAGFKAGYAEAKKDGVRVIEAAYAKLMKSSGGHI